VRLHNLQFHDVIQCEIGLVRKGVGFPHICTGVYILFVALDLFPMVVGTEVHCDSQQLKQFATF
jgi:hypothetical protein